MKILDQAFEAARTFQPMSEADLTALLNKTRDAAQGGKYEQFKVSAVFDGTIRNPQWLG